MVFHFLRSEDRHFMNNKFFTFFFFLSPQTNILGQLCRACADAQDTSQVKLGSGIFILLTDFSLSPLYFPGNVYICSCKMDNCSIFRCYLAVSLHINFFFSSIFYFKFIIYLLFTHSHWVGFILLVHKTLLEFHRETELKNLPKNGSEW